MARRLATLVALGSTVLALHAGSPAAAGTPAAPPPPTPPLTWSPCGDMAPGLDCATVSVPLDHADPGGQRIDVAISRRPATDPALRRGVMLLNPGGPGGSGLTMPLAVTQLLQGRPEILTRYDLIGFDPRFVGHSTPATCELTLDEMKVPRWPAGGFTGEVQVARTVAGKCVEHAGWALQHASTRNVARDLDIVRAALGEQRISYLGYSYGTDIGRAYLSQFPERVDRFVLDSNTNPLRSGRDSDTIFAPNFERMLGLFSRFAAANPDRYGLGADATAVRRAFDGLISQALATPVVSGDEVFPADDIRSIAFRLLYAENRFDLLGRFVSTLRAGQPLPADIAFLSNLRRFTSVPGVPLDNFIAAFFLFSCGDSEYPRDLTGYRRDAAVFSALYPFAGPPMANISPCAFWPAIDREPAPALLGNPSRILIVNSLGDPATPFDGALTTRVLLPHSRLVTVPVSHHAVLGEYPNTCVESAVSDYFVNGQARDVACPATPDAPQRPARADAQPVMMGA